MSTAPTRREGIEKRVSDFNQDGNHIWSEEDRKAITDLIVTLHEEWDDRYVPRLQEWIDELKTLPSLQIHKKGVAQGREDAAKDWAEAVQTTRWAGSWRKTRNNILRAMGVKPVDGSPSTARVRAGQ